jgi:hypothetical protein
MLRGWEPQPQRKWWFIFGEHQDIGQNVIYEGDGIYRVTIWVDAQNSFRAKIRSHFRVKLRDVHNGTWTMIGPLQCEP